MEWISQYIEDMKLAWSPTTLRSERYRLLAVVKELDGSPTRLWKATEGLAPYARVTTWTRVTAFWDWLLEKKLATGVNEYRTFRKRNARQFKNAYKKNVPEISFEEAKERISKIRDVSIKTKALELLTSGMRWNESFTLRNGTVVGKGGKRRDVYLEPALRSEYAQSYSKFWRALAEIGLKPHDLRKLCINAVIDAGANPFELCDLAGWSDLKTAMSYTKSRGSNLKNLMKKAIG